MSAPAQLPFDQVAIGDDVMSTAAFLALPLFKRVRFVLAGELRFLRDGEPMDQSDALRALREQSS
jgi:hypothetical protein